MKAIKKFVTKCMVCFKSFIKKIFSKKESDVETDEETIMKPNFIVLIRRGLLSEWADENPILREKELVAVRCPNSDGVRCARCKKFIKQNADNCGYCGNDLHQESILYKIGDGITNFNDLPFINDINSIKVFRTYQSRTKTCIEIYLDAKLYNKK